MLQELHLDKAFMGTIGFTLKEGLTTTDPGEAFTKELVLGQARQVVAARRLRQGRQDFLRPRRRVEKVHVLITDERLEKNFAKELVKTGIK